MNPFVESAQFFASELQQFQYYDKYSRFDNELGRRETWIETVDRAVSFLQELSDGRLEDDVYERIRNGILNLQVMPSMRLLASAGPQARRQNISCYNSAYVPLDCISSLVEILILSMNGSGVGYSVESKYVNRFPAIKPQNGFTVNHVVADSTEGWASALKTGLEMWFEGYDVNFDYSLVRPAGSVLRVKGGHASGPEPLRNLLDFCRATIIGNTRLTTLQVHDIACEIGFASISGGNRRTALLSLFDADDQLMLHCKDGNFPSRRWNANNSAVWPNGIDYVMFSDLFDSMVDGARGEPGIFVRENAERTKPEWRSSAEWGSNPCGEVFLRPMEMCNLSVAVARADDTVESLLDKVELATIIGTIQSMATNFPGLRPEWKHNCEEERLLGVDINGQMDSEVARRPVVQRVCRMVATKINQVYAQKLGINRSAAITCVKPSGNSAAMLNCSSGIHARWSDYYIRNARISAYSPLFKVLQHSEVPMDPENGQDWNNMNTAVVHFPVKSPDGAITRSDLTAIQQCAYWLQVKENWTHHNPSVTITYRPEEVYGLSEWLWKHRGKIGGMAFLPADDSKYAQLPYEEITKEEYHKLAQAFPPIDFSKIAQFETHDTTVSAPGCESGVCEWQGEKDLKDLALSVAI